VAEIIILYWTVAIHLAAFITFFYVIIWRSSSPIVSIRCASRLAKLIICFALLNIAIYLFAPNFADYGEVTIALLSGNLLAGAPVYGDWTSGHFLVGSNYGPAIFAIEAAFTAVLPSVLGSKLPGVVLSVVGFVAFYASVGAPTKMKGGRLVPVAVAILIYSVNYDSWFWNRPDPALNALTAFACVVEARCPREKQLPYLILLAAVAFNLKVFAPIYLAPLAAPLLYEGIKDRKSVPLLILGVAAFALLAYLPFAFNSFSLEWYKNNILLMMNQGLKLGLISASLAYGCLIIMPVMMARLNNSSYQFQFISLAASMLAVAILSGKPGGGPYYMMPFVPSALYIAHRISLAAEPTARIWWTERLGSILLILSICFAPIWGFCFVKETRSWVPFGSARDKAEEIRSLFRKFPNAEMGHGRTPVETDFFFRVQKAFLGQIVHFDYVNYMEQRGAGVSPSIFNRLLADCRIPSWVFPRGTEYWDGIEFGATQVYNEKSRRLFRKNYVKQQTGRYFEVWTCSRAESHTHK
jgi:hypothetical protein